MEISTPVISRHQTRGGDSEANLIHTMFSLLALKPFRSIYDGLVGTG